jgi:hypothetical protein
MVTEPPEDDWNVTGAPDEDWMVKEELCDGEWSVLVA